MTRRITELSVVRRPTIPGNLVGTRDSFPPWWSSHPTPACNNMFSAYVQLLHAWLVEDVFFATVKNCEYTKHRAANVEAGCVSSTTNMRSESANVGGLTVLHGECRFQNLFCSCLVFVNRHLVIKTTPSGLCTILSVASFVL